MKKLFALLICIAIMLSLFGCGGSTDTPAGSTASSSQANSSTPEGTDSSEGNGGTNSTTPSSTTPSSSVPSSTEPSTQPSTAPSSSATSSSTQGGEDVPTGPVIVPDRTSYKPTTVGSGANKALNYVTETLFFPSLTPYYNGYKTALTMTFDDGYDTGTGTIISDQFEKYGFRGTMMIGPCFIQDEGTIQAWNNVFARGYLDLGCHGYNHKEPTTLDKSEYEHEIKDAIMFLREKFPGQRVLTFATPFAHINNSYEEYLSQFVIGNRLEEGGTGVKPADDFNPYRVKAISVNLSSSTSSAHTALAGNIKSGTWQVELFHCVIEGAVNRTDIEKSTFEAHCEYLYRNYRNDVWFATFEEVLVYAEQLKHTTVEYTACDRESMTFTVTPDGTLDKELYNIPMSLKVYLPLNLCDSAYAEVNGVYQPLEIIIEQATGLPYAIVKEIPVESQATVKVIMGGNSTMKNNCGRHNYRTDEVVEPTHDTIGYTVIRCSKCDTTYKSKFTPKQHDFTGEETVVIAPRERANGISKFNCLHCDAQETREIEYVPTEE